MRIEQIDLLGGAPEYDAFVDKFKPKLTTDDCYTPEIIYEAVADWVAAEYSLDRSRFVRPFWPEADYAAQEYPGGCVVVDNPPFSIRAEILTFYQARRIPFFLFSPALTLISREPGVCHIAVGVGVTYENGAEIPTSFVTNLESCALRTAPTLYKAVEAANEKNLESTRRSLPRYAYPDEIVTAAMAQRWSRYGVEFRLPAEDCVRVSFLDAQRARGKAIFGGGFLISRRAAAERAAAERWELSPRELQIVDNLERRTNNANQ